MDARVAHFAMKELYKGATGEKTLAEDRKEDLLGEIVNQGCRIPRDAIVQQRVDNIASGREQYFLGGASFALTLVIGWCVYKGITTRTRKKRS